MPAPIVVFAYNRPDHLQRTLSALAQNPLADQSDLFVYCDGAKTPDGQSAVDATRAVADAATGFAKVTVVKRERNFGLRTNIIEGVTQIVQDYGRIIIVEDDVLTSPYFLTYMNEALDLYAENPKVACIHGWCFPHNIPNPPDTFFLRGADCWGWATWADKWAVYNPDSQALLTEVRARKLESSLNLDGAYDCVGMLKNESAKRIDTWDVQWYTSAFLADMYCLYPGKSLVENIGLDGSGIHCGTGSLGDQSISTTPVRVAAIPVQDDPIMRQAIQVWFRRTGNPVKKLLLHYFPWLLPIKKKLLMWSRQLQKQFRNGS